MHARASKAHDHRMRVNVALYIHAIVSNLTDFYQEQDVYDIYEDTFNFI